MGYEPSEDNAKLAYPEHQLVPLKGGRYKTILKGPPGTEIGDLHCDLEPFVAYGAPVTISHSGWQPSAEQVRMLASGAHVRLSVWQHPIPPLAVAVEPPICRCHSEPCAWLGGTFVCSQQTTAEALEAEALNRAKRDFTPESAIGEDPER